ncbi:hypothetical protein GCM10020220_103620 [Nonomuraea rubra]
MKDPAPSAPPAGDAGAPLRRERIVALVLEHEFVRVTDLAETFGVSSVTIRGDLEVLGRQGALRRVRGGAMHVKAAPPPEEASSGTAVDSLALEKTQLARHAAALVADGENIIIDAGTTATFLARELVARGDLADVVIFTNSLRVAAELEPAIPRFSVLVTGGTLRPATHALVDPLGGAMLERIHADTVFLGCHGVHLESGLTGGAPAGGRAETAHDQRLPAPGRAGGLHEAGPDRAGADLCAVQGQPPRHRRRRGARFRERRPGAGRRRRAGEGTPA